LAIGCIECLLWLFNPYIIDNCKIIQKKFILFKNYIIDLGLFEKLLRRE